MTDRAALQTMVIQANPVPDPVATAEHLDAYRSLLALIDQRSGAMDHHTEPAETPPDTPPPPPPQRSRAPAWAFALAFIVVLVAVGVAALVMVRDNEDEEVVDEPITTTTLAARQTTTTPPTTTAVNRGGAEPVSFVTGLGTLTWTEVAEDDVKDALRNPVIFNPEFGYVSCNNWASCWVSGDGLSWRPVEGLADHDNAVLVRGFGNTRPMALASPLFDTWGDWNSAAINAALREDAATVFALEDGHWVEVGSVGPLPDAVDIFWAYALPRAPSGEYAFEMDLVSALPLVEVYGRFDDPTCEGGECREKPARAKWNTETEVLRIEHPFGGGVLARLKIAVSGNTATFQDVDSGDVAFELVGDATVPIEPIVEDMKEASSPVRFVGLRGVWTASFGSEFEFHLPPLSRMRSIYAAPDGSGYVAYDRLNVAGPVRVWTSQDAIRWGGPSDLPFSRQGGALLAIRSESDVIYALVRSPEEDGLRISEFWVSTDGVTWVQRANPPGDVQASEFPSDHVQATEFGFVATAITEKRKSGEWRTRARFWLSIDEHSWIEVEGPPGPHVTIARGQPQAWAQGVGSNIYWHARQAHSASWVGRFES